MNSQNHRMKTKMAKASARKLANVDSAENGITPSYNTRDLCEPRGQGTLRSESAATPAAALRPTLPSTLTGCRVIWLLLPPSSTLAPTPTPTVPCAVAPAYSPAIAPGAMLPGANTSQTTV